MARINTSKKSPQGQRQLRVGEEMRHALAEIFLRGETYDEALQGASITVSEVRISPDLKSATAYVMPLGGINTKPIMDGLMRAAPMLRTLVGKRLQLRYTPRLGFKLDTTFEEAGRIQMLLNNPDVARDLRDEA